MQYSCLIVDDEPIAREIIRGYCNHLSFLNVAASCSNALEAKQELQKQEVDILFLDIHLPVLDGLAFLKTLSNPPMVIFTTAYKEYALNAFDLAACDYLLKPFSFERFIVAVDKAIQRLPNMQNQASVAENKGEDFFFLRSNGKIIRIGHADFLYAEAQGNYIKIVQLHTAPVLTNMTFANFESLLPADKFIRVHRSFIISKSKISRIEGNMLFLDKTEIPIGNNYKESLMKSLRL